MEGEQYSSSSSESEDDLFANSGSEYEPESYECDSDSPEREMTTRGTAVYPSGNMKKANRLKEKPKIHTKSPYLVKRKTKPSRKTKPFSSLFDDVVFVISGFVNPLRSDIRNKAFAMGAEYKADWDKTCTHLICAFSNTPKYREVKGKGKIVKKEWIETAYISRKRAPWRRFALDTSDESLPESDEEIFDSSLSSFSTIDGRKNLKPDLDESQPSTSMARQPPCPMIPVVDSPIVKIKVEEDEKLSSSKGQENGSIYDADTDIEENLNSEVFHSWKLPYLPAFFDDVSFYICEDISESVKKQLRRYIVAHKGTLVERVNDDVEFMIADSPATIKQIKEEFPQIVAVKPEWLWRSHDENRVFPTSEFEL